MPCLMPLVWVQYLVVSEGERNVAAYIPTLLGCLIIGVPAILLAWIAFRRERALFWFAVALIAVGLGYLATTPAAEGVAKVVLGRRI